MTIRNSSRKVRSLEYAIEHLKLELEELTEEMQEYVGDFMHDLCVLVDFNGQSPHAQQTAISSEVVELVEKPVLPEDLKKLWKKIASVTHPDKTGNNPRLTRLYRRASDAVKTCSAQDLVQIATELGLESPSISREMTVSALSEIKIDLSTKLSNLENSALIRWGRSKDDAEKKNIMDLYIDVKGYARRNCNS